MDAVKVIEKSAFLRAVAIGENLGKHAQEWEHKCVEARDERQAAKAELAQAKIDLEIADGRNELLQAEIDRLHMEGSATCLSWNEELEAEKARHAEEVRELRTALEAAKAEIDHWIRKFIEKSKGDRRE